MSDDDFDWDDVDVVIPHQASIAVYINPHGDVVIRQDGDWYRRDDAWIVVRPENARRLAEAIMELAEPEALPRLALPAPADRTAAERQRRYRNAKRNGSTVTPTVTGSVTRRDAPELFEVRPPD
jgi:hypothetical protein